MKKYYSVISSIFVAIVLYIAVILDGKINDYVASTFNGYNGMIYRALVFFVVGICIGLNIWLLQQSEKSVVSLIISIVIILALTIFVFYYLNNIVIYPIILIGIYAYMLVSKLLCKK
jgi:cytochrome bd-type quinol oxidase subunit 2